jgi:hypothetical protein
VNESANELIGTVNVSVSVSVNVIVIVTVENLVPSVLEPRCRERHPNPRDLQKKLRRLNENQSNQISKNKWSFYFVSLMTKSRKLCRDRGQLFGNTDQSLRLELSQSLLTSKENFPFSLSFLLKSFDNALILPTHFT